MPSILKRFMNPQADLYAFPEAALLTVEEEPPIWEEAPDPGQPGEERPAQAAEPPPPKTPIDFAQVQAEAILDDARRVAENLREQSKRALEEELDALRAAAQEEGFREGYSAGMVGALEEAKTLRANQAVQLGGEVARFLEKAALARDEMLEQTRDELRDLAITVAEKIVRVSLKSSGEIVARMIQGATEKMRRKEWVHIYIAGCDAKALAGVTPGLTATLSALSDQVRIVPMAEEESGTCIIEMPDEIIDASAATQLSNIRELLTDLQGGER